MARRASWSESLIFVVKIERSTRKNCSGREHDADVKTSAPKNNHMKKSFLLAGLVLSVLTFAFGTNHGFNDVFGPLFHPAPGIPHPEGPRRGLDSLHRWNVIAINASGLDHPPVAPGENRVFGEELGPGRSSRAMAIVHIAMFDALDAVVGGYTSYTGTNASPGPMSVDAAIAQAARDTLATLFPSQTPTFNAYLAEDLARVTNGQQRANAIGL